MTLATQAVERMALRLRELVGETHVFTPMASYLADETETRACFATMLGGPNRRTLFMLTADWRGTEGVEDVIKARTGQVLVARRARARRRLAVIGAACQKRCRVWPKVPLANAKILAGATENTRAAPPLSC
jgi:hypothetical protein